MGITRGEITSFATVHNVANTKQRFRRRVPSRWLVAWRRFLVESLLCLVLLGVIIIAAVRGHGGILIGPFVAALAAVIVQIVRHDT